MTHKNTTCNLARDSMKDNISKILNIFARNKND